MARNGRKKGHLTVSFIFTQTIYVHAAFSEDIVISTKYGAKSMSSIFCEESYFAPSFNENILPD